jgi:rod shape-determining protein MreC
MFSRKILMVVGLLVLIMINALLLTINSRNPHNSYGLGRLALSVVAPLQEVVTGSVRTLRDVWFHYFYLVNVAHENEALQRDLGRSLQRENDRRETELANLRLRRLLSFQKTISQKLVAAEIIGKDPSPWFKTVIIDKGLADGIHKGLPVVVPEGIAGQVIEAAPHYAKVLLIIDQNNAVDALVQRNRARGIVKGEGSGRCRFKYALRKHDIRVGDVLIASGLDGVFPKGVRVGQVSGVVRRTSGIFQEVNVTPFVDFEKLEEVLVVLNLPPHAFDSAP